MGERGREAAVGGVRKSGWFNDGGVYAKPLLQYRLCTAKRVDGK
jgi:hypothetical protein